MGRPGDLRPLVKVRTAMQTLMIHTSETDCDGLNYCEHAVPLMDSECAALRVCDAEDSVGLADFARQIGVLGRYDVVDSIELLPGARTLTDSTRITCQTLNGHYFYRSRTEWFAHAHDDSIGTVLDHYYD